MPGQNEAKQTAPASKHQGRRWTSLPGEGRFGVLAGLWDRLGEALEGLWGPVLYVFSQDGQVLIGVIPDSRGEWPSSCLGLYPGSGMLLGSLGQVTLVVSFSLISKRWES